MIVSVYVYVCSSSKKKKTQKKEKVRLIHALISLEEEKRFIDDVTQQFIESKQTFHTRENASN
jgi:hypothetical protein